MRAVSLWPVAFAIALALGVAGYTLNLDRRADYANPACAPDPTCDDSAPAIDALTEGDVRRFFDVQPIMGPVSLVLRAPFAALAGGQQARYNLGALACMLVLLGVALLAAKMARARGQPLWFCGVIGAGIIFSPLTLAPLDWGHPEEPLAAALAVAAALAAMRDRPVEAGVLLGLAAATKLWAFLALPLLAVHLARRGAIRATVVSLVTAIALIAPMAIGSPDRFRTVAGAISDFGIRPGTVTPANVWWPLSYEARFTIPIRAPDGQVVGQPAVGNRLSVPAARAARISIGIAALAVAFAWARVQLTRPREQLLLALALVLLLRAVLDPGTYSYYHAPFFVALVTYEGLVRRRWPVVSLVTVAGFEAVSRLNTELHTASALNWLYLAWALPLTAVLAYELARGSGVRR